MMLLRLSFRAEGTLSVNSWDVYVTSVLFHHSFLSPALHVLPFFFPPFVSLSQRAVLFSIFVSNWISAVKNRISNYIVDRSESARSTV